MFNQCENITTKTFHAQQNCIKILEIVLWNKLEVQQRQMFPP